MCLLRNSRHLSQFVFGDPDSQAVATFSTDAYNSKCNSFMSGSETNLSTLISCSGVPPAWTRNAC